MKKRPRLIAAMIVLFLLPALASGEVVRLRDGSTLRGRLVSVDGDSLVFRLAVGPRITLHRSQVTGIDFDDAGGVPVTGQAAVPTPAAPAGRGTIYVSFKDRKISSKISIEHKRDWDGHERSNAIVTELLLDGAVVYSVIDSTTDKRIYKGHTTQLRNDATLEDFSVEVPAGVHQCELIIRNADEETYHDDFDDKPLHSALVLDELEVPAGRGARIEVGIDKGTLKMGTARLYRVE